MLMFLDSINSVELVSAAGISAAIGDSFILSRLSKQPATKDILSGVPPFINTNNEQTPELITS